VPRFAVRRARQLLGINGLSSTICPGRISGRNTQQAGENNRWADFSAQTPTPARPCKTCRPSHYLAVLGRVTRCILCLFAVGTHSRHRTFTKRFSSHIRSSSPNTLDIALAPSQPQIHHGDKHTDGSMVKREMARRVGMAHFMVPSRWVSAGCTSVNAEFAAETR
jgi:hypothetical protein